MRNEWDDLVDPTRVALEALIKVGDAMADRIEELEAKLAQQDDLVQAAVAAALDRVVWAERERGFWAGRSCGGSKAEIDAALNALCQGGE